MARKYVRDNRGRFASAGATARGGRLKTASGNKRATQTMQAKGGRAGTIGKPKGLKPGAISGKLKPSAAASRANQLRQRAAGLEQRGNALMGGGRQDRAATNVSLNSRARRNETNAGFKGLEMTRAAANLRSKADRVEQRAQQSATKALRDAAGIKPKRTQSTVSRAARIAAGDLTLKNAQVGRAEKRLSTLWQRRMNSSPSKRLKAEATKKKAQAFYNTKGQTWKDRKPAAKPAPQLAVSKIQKTGMRFGDDDFQSDRKWAKNETAKLDRQKRKLEKELARLKRAQAATSMPAKPAAKKRRR